jgi:hypothetical protein
MRMHILNTARIERSTLPLLALLRHADCIGQCPLSGVTRKTFAHIEFFSVVFADIDADHGDRCVEFLRHGVLLVLSAPCQLLVLAGPEHGRTIPLADFQAAQSDVRYWVQSRGLSPACIPAAVASPSKNMRPARVTRLALRLVASAISSFGFDNWASPRILQQRNLPS